MDEKGIFENHARVKDIEGVVPKEPRFRLQDIITIINSLFKTAGTGINIVELGCYKEQVVVGFPQIESLENELVSVGTLDDCEVGARYLLLATLASSSGRLVSIYVRYYLTTDGKILIEDYSDNGTTLSDTDQINRPERWKKVIDEGVSWGPVIVRLILSYLGFTTDNPQ